MQTFLLSCMAVVLLLLCMLIFRLRAELKKFRTRAEKKFDLQHKLNRYFIARVHESGQKQNEQ